MNSKTIKIRQIKSLNGCIANHKANMKGLGLGKIGTIRELENTSKVRGMIKKVIHMLEFVK